MGQRLEDQTRAFDSEAALKTLLAAHSDAIVVAMADHGWRVPLPDSFPLGGHRAQPVPDTRTSILEVVAPARER
jgi:hypothetical protein